MEDYLVVRGAESSFDVFVVQDLDFEGEVLLQIFDDHDEKRQFDAEGFLGIGGACDEGSADVGAHDFED